MKYKLFSAASFLFFAVLDFILVAASIMVSYKIYRIFEIGQNVYYPKTGIIPTAILVGGATLATMWFVGAYKDESSVLNVEEIKCVVKGITISFMLFGLFPGFCKNPAFPICGGGFISERRYSSSHRKEYPLSSDPIRKFLEKI